MVALLSDDNKLLHIISEDNKLLRVISEDDKLLRVISEECRNMAEVDSLSADHFKDGFKSDLRLRKPASFVLRRIARKVRRRVL